LLRPAAVAAKVLIIRAVKYTQSELLDNMETAQMEQEIQKGIKDCKRATRISNTRDGC
jgi:hypothetical protein